MDFKLKPKNIIRFSDENTIEFSPDREIHVESVGSFKNIKINIKYILNFEKLIRSKNKNMIAYVNNDPNLSVIHCRMYSNDFVVNVRREDAIKFNSDIIIYGKFWMTASVLMTDCLFYIIDETIIVKG